MNHYDRRTTLGYLAHCREKGAAMIAAETRETLEGPAGFARRTFSRAELYAYTDEKGRIVGTILGKLSRRHGKVLELRHMRGLTFAEIGAEMDITEDAAKALYGRAAVRFRSLAGRQPGVSDFTEFLE